MTHSEAKQVLATLAYSHRHLPVAGILEVLGLWEKAWDFVREPIARDAEAGGDLRLKMAVQVMDSVDPRKLQDHASPAGT